MLWDAHMPEESSMDLVRYAVRAHPDTGPGLTGRREKGKIWRKSSQWTMNRCSATCCEPCSVTMATK